MHAFSQSTCDAAKKRPVLYRQIIISYLSNLADYVLTFAVNVMMDFRLDKIDYFVIWDGCFTLILQFTNWEKAA